ncbi:hypothetical protein BDW22DRAFT_209020 [Trametopsis cervina]|nr:hypothetical protein BDW22DRAFT_209020 [Trametopsis cervina]
MTVCDSSHQASAAVAHCYITVVFHRTAIMQEMLCPRQTLLPQPPSRLVGGHVRAAYSSSKCEHSGIEQMLRRSSSVRAEHSSNLFFAAHQAFGARGGNIRLRRPVRRAVRLDDRHIVHRPKYQSSTHRRWSCPKSRWRRTVMRKYIIIPATCCYASSSKEPSHGSEISKDLHALQAVICQSQHISEPSLHNL